MARDAIADTGFLHVSACISKGVVVPRWGNRIGGYSCTTDAEVAMSYVARALAAVLALGLLSCAGQARTDEGDAAPAETAEQGSAGSDVHDLCLPEEDGRAEVVVPDAPPRFIELSTKLQEGMDAHPEEAVAAIEAAGDGPLAYADWMGVTKAEYDEYLAIGETAPSWGYLVAATPSFGAQLHDGAATLQSDDALLASLDGATVHRETLDAEVDGVRLGLPERQETPGGIFPPSTGWAWVVPGVSTSLKVYRADTEPLCLLQLSHIDAEGQTHSIDLRYAPRG